MRLIENAHARVSQPLGMGGNRLDRFEQRIDLAFEYPSEGREHLAHGIGEESAAAWSSSSFFTELYPGAQCSALARNGAAFRVRRRFRPPLSRLLRQGEAAPGMKIFHFPGSSSFSVDIIS